MAAREDFRRKMLHDPAAKTPVGRSGMDKALDFWVLQATMREVAHQFGPAKCNMKI